MAGLNGGVDRLLALIGDAHGFETVEEFRTGILGAMRRAVPSDYASYNEVGERPGEVWAVAEPDMPPDAAERWGRYSHQHPILADMRRTRDVRPKRISDLIGQDEFHELELYHHFYRPIGVEWQVAFTLPARAPLVLGLALSRCDDDYTADECALLAAARPHLIQAYRNAHMASRRARLLHSLEDGLTAAGQLVVVVDRHGRVDFATPAALPLLTAHLDEPLHDWVAAHRSRAGGSSEPLVLGAGDDALLVRLMPGRNAAPDVLLLESGDGGMTVDALRTLGLTRREAEALRWTALGRTAPEAARLMGISPRTTSKHLQHVYAKLGVRSRSQAAATAWAAVGVRDGDLDGLSDVAAVS